VRAKGLTAILAALVAVLAAFALVRLTADGDHDRFDDGQLSFEYPSEWKQATWPVQSTFEKLVTYLSNAAARPMPQDGELAYVRRATPAAARWRRSG
jgi:hypothetical protein